MPIDLYYALPSAPCRAVLVAAKVVGVEVNRIKLDLHAGEHKTPEFLKLNPQHTIPTLNDNGFALWESRAIVKYLATQYGKDDSLYPNDPKKRAIIDQRMYFDALTLYPHCREYFMPLMVPGTSFDPEKLARMEGDFKLLDTFLEGQEWVAGNNLTVADIVLEATVGIVNDAIDFNFDKYPNVKRWMTKLAKLAPDVTAEAKKELKEFLAKK